VSYSLDIDARAQATIAALSADDLPVLAEALTVLELTPWPTSCSKRNSESRPTHRLGRLA